MSKIKLNGLFWLLCLCIPAEAAFSQSHPRGLDFNDASYASAPKKATLTRALDALPAQASIKQYAPYPKTQEQYGTCTAWASAYCGRTILDAIKNNWTDKDLITDHAYSPAFLFRMLRPADAACQGGSDVEYAFQLMKQKGSIPFKDLPQPCVPGLSDAEYAKAAGATLKDFARLFDVNASDNFKVQAVKKSISEKKPVVIAMICPPSFDHAYKYWQPTEAALEAYGGHAMCVVGYDDAQYGGAFEIQNSWGTNWGNEGYTWIRYDDFAKFVRYGYEFIDLPDEKPDQPDLSGSLRLVLSTGQEMPANLQVSTRGLKVVPAKMNTGPLTSYKTAGAYASGTNFRVYISNNEPAYVYAISSDLSNQVTKIFPYQDGISAALTYKKNDVAIPDEDHYIQFDNSPGKDFLCVLYSRNELDINTIIGKITSLEGTFNERVFKALGGQMVEPANVKFAGDKIAFEGISKGKDMIALMVELDHK
ncbi:MAG TPA: C1 family peptidase [Mucilaginibacter sp.]|jgi:hypothetical protein|nr:C1 family peptidase [Mucilaginibacter sp.]